MAASTNRRETKFDTKSSTSDQNLSSLNNEVNKTSPSKDLLYSEKFPDSGHERLKIVSNGQCQAQNSGKIFKLPPSSVLDRVKGFLPQLATSNADVERRLLGGESTNLDIENVDTCTGPVIEMNLALVEMDSDVSNEDLSSSDSDSESSDNDSDCGMNQIGILGPVTEDNLKLSNKPCKKTKALIQVVEDKSRELNKTDVLSNQVT